jgi:hypothetical protein
MARCLSDESFSLRVVHELRAFGHDTLTARDISLANRGIGDLDIFRVAVADGRAILTHDRRDYVRLHMQQPRHAGIVICTYDPDVRRLAQRIHDAVAGLDSLAGRLIRINRPGPAEDQP